VLIVDAQVHIWAADMPERPWPAEGHGRAHRPAPFSKNDLLREMDAAGVARAVIVPPSWEGDRNDLALAAAAAHPDRFAVMGRPPLAPAERHRLDHTGIPCTYAQAISLFTEKLAWLRSDDLEWVMGAARSATGSAGGCPGDPPSPRVAVLHA
jgi:hypothetical protein